MASEDSSLLRRAHTHQRLTAQQAVQRMAALNAACCVLPGACDGFTTAVVGANVSAAILNAAAVEER